MAYRSDVYIKCTKDAVDSIYAALQANDMLDCTDMSYDDDFFYFNLFDIKWYADYSDIIAIMDVLSNNKSHIGFLRIGEGRNDVEEYGEFRHNWYTQTHIESPTGGPFHTDRYIAQHHPELVI